MSLFVAITTIQSPTPSVRRLREFLAPLNVPLVVAGDRKGPVTFDLEGCIFLPINVQQEMPFKLAKLLPVDHYSRKNLAYLEAIRRGATNIYETDDDNAPNEHFALRSCRITARAVGGGQWVNAYSAFTSQSIWPRGFPLSLIRSHSTHLIPHDAVETIDAPIQQGLADIAPDVDAVWRMVFGNDFHFDRGDSVILPVGCCCPFNSQSTWWWSEAFPLLYLPSTCSFRMTDIWRSFVAQRCLWEDGHRLVFHASEVNQARNEHRLEQDFEEEISGYIHNERIVTALNTIALSPGSMLDNIRSCYSHLIREGFLPRSEMPMLDAWLTDISSLGTT